MAADNGFLAPELGGHVLGLGFGSGDYEKHGEALEIFL
jgi:hypothetical protein